ncbi:MAG: hypothetical protein HYU58_08820 [Proteobacteria bacterium]|nr:hypothetical protein [Pseudomonadota bacterium]
MAPGFLVAGGCFLAAGLVNYNWQRAADRNADELVAQINQRITASVARQIKNQLDSAESALAALRTVFFQDVIRIDNEAKREFVFLSSLQSSGDLSWVTFGWPDGSFFGARKDIDNNVHMIEVKKDARAEQNLRIDDYLATAHDIQFQQRRWGTSAFNASLQPWYLAAQNQDHSAWTEGDASPLGERDAITVSDRLTLYGRYIGVLAVSIDLERLARFVDRLEITKRGQALILGPDGRALTVDGWHPVNDMHDSGKRAVSATLAAMPGALTRITRPVSLMGEDPLTHRGYYLNVSRLPYRDWSLVIAIPTADILGDIPATTRRLYVVVGILAVLVAAAAFLMADRLVTRPLAGIAKQLRAIGGFDLHAIRYRPSALREFDQLSRSLVQMGAGLGSFRKYLPADLVISLVRDGREARLGGQKRQLTVLFSDLAGFTSLTEAEPERMVHFLGAHFDDMSQAIHATGGTIDKFIGDSVMAFWNAPNPHEQPEIAACRSALAARARFHALLAQADWRFAAPPGLRIGINTGSALVGNIGSQDRLNYTALGDTVNVASRFESLNKQYGTEILIGADTAAALDAGFHLRKLDQVAVYGRRGGSFIYELIAETDPDTARPDWIACYEQGLDAYFRREWQQAQALFVDAARLRGDDPPSRVMAGRCAAFMTTPPDADWAGIAVAAVK